MLESSDDILISRGASYSGENYRAGEGFSEGRVLVGVVEYCRRLRQQGKS